MIRGGSINLPCFGLIFAEFNVGLIWFGFFLGCYGLGFSGRVECLLLGVARSVFCVWCLSEFSLFFW